MANAPLDWKSRAPRPPAGTSTFAEQDVLPRLPVPDLDVTLAKLERSISPLAHSAHELDITLRKIQSFGARGGVGRTLHGRLLARANDPGRVNWLEEFWDAAAYLTYRDSVVINVSYYYGFEDQPSHLPQTPANRAASLTRSALLFRRALKQGRVEPDRVKEGPLCMDSWRWMFDCCRVPGLDGKDFSVTAAKEGETGDSGFVVVIRKGRFWKLDVSVQSRLLSTAELERQIQHIYDNTTYEFPPVGVLPTNNRDIWASDYVLLSQSKHNQTILDTIESCAFVVCLDSETPETHVEFSKANWYGGVEGAEVGNRWFDKPVQFVIWDNGKAGMVGEHSVMDGTPTSRMSGEVVAALRSPAFDHGTHSMSPAILPPQPLDWELSLVLQASIDRAKTAVHALISSHTLTFLRTSYGKAQIKAFGFSPDSWTQMVIQLAYHRLVGGRRNRYGGTYEAATTRRFQHGRTEAIRVVTEESTRWCESMDPDVSISKEERRKLLATACTVHGKDARAAGSGLGIDRHLFGLRKMIKEGETTPEIFADPLFVRSSTWVLSTSAIYDPSFQVYGWGEVVPQGFGVPYAAGFDDYLQFTLTSRKEMPNEQFSAELDHAAEDMRALFDDDSLHSKL